MLQRITSNPNLVRILPQSGSSLRRWSGAALSRYLSKDEGAKQTSRARSQRDEQREAERVQEMKQRRVRLQELLQRAHSEYQSRQRPQ